MVASWDRRPMRYYRRAPGTRFNVGKVRGQAVTDDYLGKAPWPFTGGTIHNVIVNVSGPPFVDIEKEPGAMFARD
jgi:hypothetical protein